MSKFTSVVNSFLCFCCKFFSNICIHIQGRCSDLIVVLFISYLNQDIVFNINEANVCGIKLFLLNEFITINRLYFFFFVLVDQFLLPALGYRFYVTINHE